MATTTVLTTAILALLALLGTAHAGPGRPVAGSADLAKAAQELGFPVALKIDAQDVVHKTEAGALRLGIKNEEELDKAFRELQEKFASKQSATLVQKMMPAGKEVIVGFKRDPQAGPLIMFGLGGIFVELMRDAAFKLAPLCREEALEMIQGIKAYPLLAGFRGDRGADIEALVDILIRVSNLACDNPGIQEMDLNPVFAYPAGRKSVVVDARARIR